MMDGHIILLTITRSGYYYYYHYGCSYGHEQLSVAIGGFTWAASWPSLALLWLRHGCANDPNDLRPRPARTLRLGFGDPQL